ncbi:esterase-like activity of phytase family protein [Phytohabitans flavus]|uniref:effector-associated constant component EACC1 n=1 Tax=Phytohabitans flavus TaxID=1076124 RepID=UPI001564FB1B|nr:esterase-like activity of phytase family protein [Phytohabitans flavus]
MDSIEFRFEAGDANDGSHDDLRTLYTHLAADHELRKHAKVSAPSGPVRPGEMGVAEVVTVVSTVASVGQLAVALQVWREALNRPTTLQLVVPDGHRDNARAVFDALRGAGLPEERHETVIAAAAGSAGVKPTGRIDPANSACVLIGIDSYDDPKLPSLRAVYNNIEQLYDVLTDEDVWGVEPGRIRKVHNPRTPAELIRPIREMSELAADTLIVYYAGHGLKDLDENELYLALPHSVPGELETSVRFKAVMQAIAKSRQAQRVVMIIDCCHSGIAIDGGMSEAVDDIRADADIDDVQGMYFMCATAPNRKALAPSAEKCTVFTGELVDVLREGIPQESELMLSLGVIFREVRRRLKRDSRPVPGELDNNQVGHLPFTRNIARIPQRPPVLLPPSPRPRVLRSPVFAAGIVIGIVLGLGVPPGIDRVRELRAVPVPAGGQCSTNATLLSYSDQLDKTEVSGERITGLSALALTGSSEGFALADNEPGRVFPLTLENPDDLHVSAGVGRTLRDTNGVPYSKGIDGEGLVIERGNKTMLVSSEKGPSIRRFDISTGHELEKPIVVPQMLQDPPTGDAQFGRTIESLAATPDGRYLYAGWEAPLSGDSDQRGRNRLRIQRYRGEPGGTYTPDYQYAYETGAGLYLTELAVVGQDRLLALERQYVEGLGNVIQVHDVRLDNAEDVTGDRALADNTADMLVPRTLLFDLRTCPAGSPGQVTARQPQSNPLLDNVEGMAVGPEETAGPEVGTRLLYLITDDNSNSTQVTRLYAFRIRLPA